MVAQTGQPGHGLRFLVPSGFGRVLQDGAVDQDGADEAGEGGLVRGEGGAVGGGQAVEERTDLRGGDFAVADFGHNGIFGLERGTGAEKGHGEGEEGEHFGCFHRLEGAGVAAALAGAGACGAPGRLAARRRVSRSCMMVWSEARLTLMNGSRANMVRPKLCAA